MGGPIEANGLAELSQDAVQPVAGDGPTTPVEDLRSPEDNPTFALPLFGDWGLVGGSDGMFAVRYIKAKAQSKLRRSFIMDALVILSDRGCPITLTQQRALGLETARLKVHDGPKGRFDTTLVPLFKDRGMVTVGDYELSYQEALSPEGEFLLLKINAPEKFGKATIHKDTSERQVLQELTRQSQT